MENAFFEYTIKWDEEKYKSIWSNSKHRYLRSGIFFIVGIVCLFNSYTFIVGCLIILGSILGFFSPKIFSVGLRSNFKGHKYLHETLRYGVNDSTLWVQGKKIDAKCNWTNLVTWQITGDWLILTPSGIPQIVFPINEMKQNDTFEKIIDLAKKFGREFK